MARKILVPIDMTGLEIRNVRIHLLAADPGAPTEGQIWYNTTDHVMRYRKNGSTVDIGSAGSIAASAVTYAGGTGMSATDVEAAIDELATEKANVAGDTYSGTHNFTGAVINVPTAAPGDNDNSAASTAFVKAAIDALIASAPGALDTLDELAAALGDDANFATTVTNALAAKAGKYSTTITGGSTSEVITHNLGTRDVVVSVHDATTYDEVECDVQKTTANTITLGFATAPAAGAYRVTVLG